MTTQEYINRLDELYTLVGGDLTDFTIVVSGNELLQAIKNRITNEGRNSQDNPIGQYSTKPLYAEPNQFIKGGFIPQGKNVNKFGLNKGDRLVPTVRLKESKKLVLGHKFLPKVKERKYKRYSIVKSDYTQRKTMYLQEGYKQLRDIQGLRTDIMNFTYRGDLIESYQSQKEAQTVLLGLTDEKSAQKRERLEDRFGNVFYATEGEKQSYIDRTNYLLNRLTANTIKGYNVTAQII